MAFKVRVEGFAEGAFIPRRLTCDGDDVSPALDWAGEPKATKSFALIADDRDAPGGTWNHWLLWDIPASVHSLPQGIGEGSVGKSGTNDFGRSGYAEDCCLAAENLMLAARDEGLGTCWIGFARPWLDLPSTKHEMGLPAGHHVVAPIVLGYPKAWPESHGRNPAEIHWLD